MTRLEGHLRGVLLAAMSALLVGACPAQDGYAQLPLALGDHRILAEVAATPAERAHGLMQRVGLAADRGMLFVFPEAGRHCLWMKDTLIPLSVAFLDARGRILNIAEMQPESRTLHCAGQDARYALEMNAGWFERRGARPGMVLTGLTEWGRLRPGANPPLPNRNQGTGS